MGMSGDFELAIEYGATTVRVGQAIFGARASRRLLAPSRSAPDARPTDRPSARQRGQPRLSILIGGTSSAGSKPRIRPRK